MTTLLEIDPNVVKPGWMPLIILLVLAAAMVLLYRSMRHQFTKISLPTDRSGEGTPPGAGASDEAGPAPNGRPDQPSHPTGSAG